jgi:nicotinamidase-related amidase
MKRNSSPPGTLRLTFFSRVALLAAFAVVFTCGAVVGMYHWRPFVVLKAGEDDLPKEQTGKPPTNHKSNNSAYELATYRQSYYKRDDKGALKLQQNLPIRSENTYRLQRTIHPNKTAIIIMDPWVDMASEHLNKYYGKIAKSRIMPLVYQAIERGHPIIVFTNDPDIVDHNTKIHPELAALAAMGKANMLYHQDLDDDAFADHLRLKGVDSLIYTGFASNMCVIGRRTGMIPMVHHGFRLFFVPQASAAVEYPDTWENQSIHQATTKIISQWVAEIIDYNEFMQATTIK